MTSDYITLHFINIVVPGVTICDAPVMEYHWGSPSQASHVGIPQWYSTTVCPLQNASVEIAAGLQSYFVQSQEWGFKIFIPTIVIPLVVKLGCKNVHMVIRSQEWTFWNLILVIVQIGPIL